MFVHNSRVILQGWFGFFLFVCFVCLFVVFCLFVCLFVCFSLLGFFFLFLFLCFSATMKWYANFIQFSTDTVYLDIAENSVCLATCLPPEFNQPGRSSAHSQPRRSATSAPSQCLGSDKVSKLKWKRKQESGRDRTT